MIPEHTLNAIGSLLSVRDRIELISDDSRKMSVLREIADECPGLLMEVRRLNLQNDELRRKLTTDISDQFAYFRDGFSKHGFILHPGLTPEQNAAEWKKQMQMLEKRNDLGGFDTCCGLYASRGIDHAADCRKTK